MYNITICIPTYKRPIMLKKLIVSIIGCNLNKSLIKDVNIIIVDNDTCMTAESVVNELKNKIISPFRINYFVFPVKGLSNVRNELLRRALDLNTSFIVFIDDDEYPSPEWLNELVKTIVFNNGDMARGPVISVFDYNVSKYITYWFEHFNKEDDKNIKSIATNNLIIRTDALVNFQIWFDQRFNTTGGEDSYFGIQMIKKGAKMHWASNAIVYETIPENRSNIKYIIKKYYNGANIFTYNLKIEKLYLKLLKKTLTSFLYLFAGVFATCAVLIPIKRKYWGLIKISEGLGGFAGLFSLRYHGYK